MSDRIAVMDGGTIAQLGSPSDIFERPRTRFVAEFVGIGNLLPGTVTGGRLALGGGMRWDAASPPPAAEGGAVTIAVRPHKIQVRLDGAPGVGNSTRASLREVVYVGALIRLIIELPGGQQLVAENLPENFPFDYHTLAVGQTVTLEVPREALHVYVD